MGENLDSNLPELFSSSVTPFPNMPNFNNNWNPLQTPIINLDLLFINNSNFVHIFGVFFILYAQHVAAPRLSL